MHPDLANPPVYPVVLAGLMKVLPFDYTISTTKPFWSNDGRFWRFQPDFLIALFNQLLFLAVIALVFFLARRLFDPGVAWLSAGLLLGTELFWRFSVSGLSTMLLLVIFLGLVWCLVLLEQETRAPKWGPFGILILAGLTGAMVGLGGLTRYSFGWLIIPVLVFLILFGGQRRIVLALIALAAFAAVMAPWIARNYSVSGRPFGTATYAVVETTMLYPENRLQRSLEPDFSRLYLTRLLAQAEHQPAPNRHERAAQARRQLGYGLLPGRAAGRVSQPRHQRACATSCWGAAWCWSWPRRWAGPSFPRNRPRSTPRTCWCCWRRWCWSMASASSFCCSTKCICRSRNCATSSSASSA